MSVTIHNKPSNVDMSNYKSKTKQHTKYQQLGFCCRKAHQKKQTKQCQYNNKHNTTVTRKTQHRGTLTCLLSPQTQQQI